MNSILRLHPLNHLQFTRGSGCHLYDASGKEYLDFESGTWSLALGHCHPQVNQVIHEQIDQLMHLGVTYRNSITEAAASDLLAIMGKPNGKCTFLSSGSEVVDLAIAIARKVSGRRKTLVFRSSYLSANDSTARRSADEWIQVDWHSMLAGSADEVLNQIPFDEIGVFAFESGGSGSESVHFPEPAWIQTICQRIRSSGGVVVANEVTTGFGRLGTWFGYEHYGIMPDIVAVGKCLGNGYPVSAVAVDSRIAEAIERLGFHHAQSHQNDPLGCAVAREVLRVMSDESWIERGNQVGTYFLQKLKTLERFECIKEARGRGMLLALEFHQNTHPHVAKVFDALLERGFIVACAVSRDFLRFDPPLILQSDHVDQLIECLETIMTGF